MEQIKVEGVRGGVAGVVHQQRALGGLPGYQREYSISTHLLLPPILISIIESHLASVTGGQLGDMILVDVDEKIIIINSRL